MDQDAAQTPAGEAQTPAWDWRVAPERGDTDAATARAAYAQRIAWRRANPEAWQAELARLGHNLLFMAVAVPPVCLCSQIRLASRI